MSIENENINEDVNFEYEGESNQLINYPNPLFSNQVITLQNRALQNSYNNFGSIWSKVNSYPILSKEEEIFLFESYIKTGDSKYLNKIILSHLRIVIKVANIYKNYLIDRFDLLSEGMIGLINAVKKFDLKKNIRFATYAVFWIKDSIQKYIMNNFSSFKITSNAANKRSFFGSSSSRKISIEHNYESRIPTKSFTDEELLNLPSNHTDQESIILDASRKKELNDVLNIVYNSLDNQKKYIMLHRILSENKKTLKEIATELKLSEETVRLTEKKILSTLKLKLKDF